MLDLKSVLKYLLEGLAVAVAAFYIPQRKVDLQEIAMIAVTAAAVFMVLDFFAPSVAVGARQGTGFGIGYKMVGGYYEEAKKDEKKDKKDKKDADTASTGSTEPATTATTTTSDTASTASSSSGASATPGPVGAGDASAKHEPFVSQPAPIYE